MGVESKGADFLPAEVAAEVRADLAEADQFRSIRRPSRRSLQRRRPVVLIDVESGVPLLIRVTRGRVFYHRDFVA